MADDNTPVAWQWRQRGEEWNLRHTSNFPPKASEGMQVRALYAGPVMDRADPVVRLAQIEHRLAEIMEEHAKLIREHEETTSRARKTNMQDAAGVDLPDATFMQGNWSHPDGDGSRIVGWRIPAVDVERMGVDAYRLPQEVIDALTKLAGTSGVGESQNFVEKGRAHGDKESAND